MNKKDETHPLQLRVRVLYALSLTQTNARHYPAKLNTKEILMSLDDVAVALMFKFILWVILVGIIGLAVLVNKLIGVLF